MHMIIVGLSAVTFLCEMVLFVSGLPVANKCQTPTNLNVHYEKLAVATQQNKTSTHGDTTCPTSLPLTGETKDRSTCPWYTKVVTDSTLFPSVRLEAECRCRECIGSNGLHGCERVYSEMKFLKRTPICVDGVYVYEPVTKYIPQSCVCAHKKFVQVPHNADADADADI